MTFNTRTMRLLRQIISQFAAKNLEKVDNDEVFVDVLDVLEKWEAYRIENCPMYQVDAKEIIKTIEEAKGVQIDEDKYRIVGVKFKAPRVRPPKPKLTEEELEELSKDSEMRARFGKFIHDRSVDYRTAPFETFDFANFKASELVGGSYSMTCREVSLEDAKAWLSKQPFLYYDEPSGMWHFHQRECPDFS